MLERLRQVVGREKHKRQCPDKVADHTDKTAPQYQNRLLVARLATAAVRNGCATAEQQRMVAVKRNQEREYRDLDAFCRVNEKMDKVYFEFFIPNSNPSFNARPCMAAGTSQPSLFHTCLSFLLTISPSPAAT